MLKRKVRKIGIIASMLVLAAFMAMPAFAGTYNYSATLPAWQTPTAVCGGNKDNFEATAAGVSISSLGNNNDSARLWVNHGSTKETMEYVVSKSANTYLRYGSGGYGDKYWTGSAQLMGRAEYWGSGSTYISGSVNYDVEVD